MKSQKKFLYVKKQQGAVLVMSLLLLTVITIIAVTSMKTSVIGEKMSGNLRDSELAHQAAESALLDAQTFISNMASLTELTSTNGLLREGSDSANLEPDYWDNATWSTAANYTDANPVGDGQLARTPAYIIKHMGRQKICNSDVPLDFNDPARTNACYREVFRITGHGAGLSPGKTKTLQSFFERELF